MEIKTMQMQVVDGDAVNALKTRFAATLEKVASDQDVLDKIKNRSLLEQLFANSTRDIAKAAIAQNELISELSAEIKEALDLISQGCMRQQDMMIIVDRLLSGHKSLCANFRSVFSEIAENRNSIKYLEKKEEHCASRLDSGESVRKCVLDIRGFKKGHMAPEDVFDAIVQIVRNRFAETRLRNDDKRAICQAVADAGFQDVALNGIACKMEIAVERELDKIADELEQYVQYKERLVKLIDDFLSKRNIVDPKGNYVNGLINTRKELNESQFEIALVGEFQGGKSTTFNMLCGGREISPRGLNGGGIKTSAAVITAQNIDGNETKDGLREWAEVTWLSEEEINRRIAEVISDFAEGDAKKTIKESDFADLIESAWKKSPGGDLGDRLRIATLQQKIVSSGKYREWTKKTVLPIDQFQHLVRFPEEWEPKWCKWIGGGSEFFGLEETLFSCLDSVLIRLHSPYLARLGCRVTDCPGLFVSQWDTGRAEKVMERSHAIWYLLGDKQMGQGDKRALRRICDNRWGDKCFFSINCKKPDKAMLSILDTDKALLNGKELGFGVEQVYLYNAFLSFRAAQIGVLSEVAVCKRDVECLAAEECEGEPTEDRVNLLMTDVESRIDALLDIISAQLPSVGLKSLAKELMVRESPLREMAKHVRDASRSDLIVSGIAKHITRNRARAILVNQGTRKCAEVLTALQKELEREERDARQTLEEAQREVAKAQSDFDDFKAEVEKEFAFLKLTAFDGELTDSFFMEFGDEIRKRIIKRAKDICIEEWHGSHWNSGDVNKAAERRINDEFISLIRSKINVFVRHENLRENLAFKKFILEPTEAALSNMRKHWKELQQTNKLFDGIEIKVEIDANVCESFANSISGTVDTPWYVWEWTKDIFTLWIRRIWQSPDDRINEFFDSPNNPIGRAFDQFKGNDANRAQIRKHLGIPRQQYAQRIKDALATMEGELAQNIQNKQQRQKSKLEERDAFAKKAKELRTTIVEPSQREIEAFESEVRNFYG